MNARRYRKMCECESDTQSTQLQVHIQRRFIDHIIYRSWLAGLVPIRHYVRSESLLYNVERLLLPGEVHVNVDIHVKVLLSPLC